MSHLTFTLVIAIVISAAIGMVSKGNSRERSHHAAWVFASCVSSVVAGSWIMFLIHG